MACSVTRRPDIELMVPMRAVLISSAAVMFPSSRSRFCVFSMRSAAARTVNVVAMTSLARRTGWPSSVSLGQPFGEYFGQTVGLAGSC
jgi:hypothetical protein